MQSQFSSTSPGEELRLGTQEAEKAGRGTELTERGCLLVLPTGHRSSFLLVITPKSQVRALHNLLQFPTPPKQACTLISNIDWSGRHRSRTSIPQMDCIPFPCSLIWKFWRGPCPLPRLDHQPLPPRNLICDMYDTKPKVSWLWSALRQIPEEPVPLISVPGHCLQFPLFCETPYPSKKVLF